MLQIEYPWLLLLLPLPWLVYRHAPPFRQNRPAVRVPHFLGVVNHLNLTPHTRADLAAQPVYQRVLAVLIWLLLTFALTRPVWLENPIHQERSARDLILAIDISPSMDEAAANTASTPPTESTRSRFGVVQQVVDEFVVRRNKDRIGLLLFAGQAYPQVPLTLDHSVIRVQLKEAQVGLAGPNTAIGDAIGLAIKMFNVSEAEEKILILLTDGNDTGSSMPPLKAAQIAAEEGILIHTIGVGDSDGDAAIQLNTDTLKAIARATDGRFYHANNPEELEKIYRQLDQLTPERVKTLSYRPKRQLYHWPLAAVSALLLAGVIYRRIKLQGSGGGLAKS